MYNPYAYSFHEGLYTTYGTVARVYGILGVRPPGKDLDCHYTPYSHRDHLKQDIQLVVSDPKACSNIFTTIQVFEKTQGYKRYSLSSYSRLALL
jgi:hypothetical protein